MSDKGLAEGGKSQSRNPIISRALRLIGFAELAGSGLAEIHRAWREAKRRPPKTESSSSANTFTLTLDWRPLNIVYDEFWRSKLGAKVTTEQAKILAVIDDPEGFTVQEIASAQGMFVDDMLSDLNALVLNGLADKSNGKYQIKKHLRGLREKDPRTK